jgi:hypothetical protein
LKPGIQTKCQGLQSKGAALLHGNACLHTAAHTIETLHQLNFKVLEHSPYIPDLYLWTTTRLVH